jgi:hypothetical protein
MFPKKTLDAQDFIAALGHGRHTLTIELLFDKSFDKDGDTEVVWYVKFSQFKKPIKLNMSNAYAVGDALGTQDTSEWIGKSIEVVAYQKSITENTGGRPTKKMIWIFDILPERPQSKPLPFYEKDITGATLDVQKGLQQPGFLLKALPAGQASQPSGPAAAPGTIGEEMALKLMDGLQRKGRTVEDLINHIRKTNAALADACQGRTPPNWPQAIPAAARPMLEGLPTSAAPLNENQRAGLVKQWKDLDEQWNGARKTGEVIDPKTGEVIKTDDDDLPF